MSNKKKIELYLDGPTFQEIKDFKNIDGYTFNPSLYKKLKAENYIEFTKKLIGKTNNKPISIEVIADDDENCIRQGEKISKLGNSIYVKIPVIFTSGQSSKKTIKSLVGKNIKLNITAIFEISQVKEILPILKDSKAILSIFSGRIFDIGLDAAKVFGEMAKYIHENSNCKVLWASCRMSYDYILAQKCGADIITMQPNLAKKIALFGKSSLEYSKDTVKGFFDDAKSSGFVL